VVRAGAGSARDTLSVLDQLLGGAGPGGITPALATGLLGYTPESLLDDVVDAFAAGDGAAVFGVVDRVIETGQDPRRFTEDLLRRLRDLVIVSAVPDAPATGLIDCSQDQGERLVAQAARFGGSELSRAADLIASGLTEMRGATAPRLLLELICARVLLPGADHSTDGLGARLDRLERRLSMAPVVEEVAQQPSRGLPATPEPAPVDDGPGEMPPPTRRPADVEPPPLAPTPPAPEPTAPEPPASPAAAQAPAPPVAEPVEAPPTPAPAAFGLVDVRRVWPDLLERVREMRRYTWILLSQNAQVIGLQDNILTVGFKNAGARDSFVGGGSEEILRQAAIDVIGTDWRVEAIVDPSADPGAGTAPRVTKPAAEAVAPEPEAPAAAAPPPAARPEVIASARSGIAPTRTGSEPVKRPTDERDADAHPDDPEADDNGIDGAELLQRELGATVIDEIPHE
jgi:DNA polymerase-3 subunit gamma/tau